jgi:ATP-dependent helicase HrpB
MNLYSNEELELLERAAPKEIFLSNNKRAYRIVYNFTKALVRVKIQDLYDLHSHPRISFNNHLLTLEILAPNDRCVQITENLNEFWTGSYIQIKKELSGRYPKHEWR